MGAVTLKSAPVVDALRRVDPRLLLILAAVGMVAIFAAGNGKALLVPAALTLLLLWQAGQLRRLGRLAWQMRWLLLSVLLLHLLLTPGRTLFGTLWLSRDGLLRGLQVCLQLFSAAGLALLLPALCTPERLAAALPAFAARFGPLRQPARHFAEQLLLTLQLASRLASDWQALSGRLRGKGRSPRQWLRRLALLLQVQAGRIDTLARRSAAGDNPFPQLQPLAALDWRQRENLAALLFLLAAVLLWWL